jgi:hypothetical protein
MILTTRLGNVIHMYFCKRAGISKGLNWSETWLEAISNFWVPEMESA